MDQGRSAVAKNMSDQDFLLAFFDEYYADQLSAQDGERFRRLYQESSNQEMIDDVKRATGMFQLGLQSYYLNDRQRSGLQEIVEDAEIRKTREMQRINQLDRWEALADFRKRLVIALIVIGGVLAVINYFTPDKRVMFDPLQTLVYEAAAIDEGLVDRINLPTQENADVISFFNNHKGLGYVAAPFKKVPPGWRAEGATMIDYNPDKILSGIYYHPELRERFFYYNFKGSVDSLSKAEPFEVNGFKFYPYTSDAYNLIGWQIGSDVVGMMIGKRSAKELAEMWLNYGR